MESGERGFTQEFAYLQLHLGKSGGVRGLMTHWEMHRCALHAMEPGI